LNKEFQAHRRILPLIVDNPTSNQIWQWIKRNIILLYSQQTYQVFGSNIFPKNQLKVSGNNQNLIE